MKRIEKISFDILIASFNRASILKNCLDSIVLNDLSCLNKTLILANEQDLETIDVINSTIYRPLNIQIVKVSDIPKPGRSRNLLISESSSLYHCFIDDDASMPKEYLSNATDIIKIDSPPVFGGPDQYQIHSEPKQKIIGELLTNWFVMGPTFKRHDKSNNKTKASETDLTLCNLWIKRSVLKKTNLKFSESLARCEENLLIESLNEMAVKVSYYGNLFVYHTRRSSLIDTFKIQFMSGFYRGICFSINNKTFKPFFVIPLISGIMILLGPIYFQELLFFLVCLHIFCNVCISVKTVSKLEASSLFLYSIFFIVLVHIGFSTGIVVGSIKGLISGKSS